MRQALAIALLAITLTPGGSAERVLPCDGMVERYCALTEAPGDVEVPDVDAPGVGLPVGDAPELPDAPEPGGLPPLDDVELPGPPSAPDVAADACSVVPASGPSIANLVENRLREMGYGEGGHDAGEFLRDVSKLRETCREILA